MWYFQHFPDDQWDLDWAFERQIVDLTVDGKQHRAIITSGKIGIYDAIDAKTGKFLFSIDLGLQNIVSAIDPVTGHKKVNTDLHPGDGKVKMVSPTRRGGEELPAGLVESGHGRADHTAERSVHGYLPRAGRRQRRGAVFGSELGHPAAAGQ